MYMNYKNFQEVTINHIKKLYNRFFSEGSTTISVGSSDPKKGTLDNINSNDDIV